MNAPLTEIATQLKRLNDNIEKAMEAHFTFEEGMTGVEHGNPVTEPAEPLALQHSEVEMGKQEMPVFWLTAEEQEQVDQALQRLEVMVLVARRKGWSKVKLMMALQLYLEESTVMGAHVTVVG